MGRREDALESCLQALEQGQTPQEASAEFPDLTAELLPLLEVAMLARAAAAGPVPAAVQKRGRESLQRRAADRSAARRPPIVRGLPLTARAAITIGLVLVLVLGSTGLVRASSVSLPGDQLYGLKRTWEDLRLTLALQSETRYSLETEYEQERLDEIEGLLGAGRSAPISFSGLLMQYQDGDWMVSGIPVRVSPDTSLPSSQLGPGMPVAIIGSTLADGVVRAVSIQELQPGGALPPLVPSHEEERPPAVSTIPGDLVSAGATTEPPQVYQFTGIVQALGETTWKINNQTVYVENAVIVGQVRVGSEVKFQGTYSSEGRLVVDRVEVTTNLVHRQESEQNSNSSDKSGSSDSGDHEHESEDSGD